MSVSIIEETETEEQIDIVRKDISKYYGIDHSKIEFLKNFDIPYALPNVPNPKMYLEPIVEHNGNVYHCGDHLLAASLNAAMISGRHAAEQIFQKASQ